MDNTQTLLDQLKDDSILSNVDDIIDELKSDNTQSDEPETPIKINEEDLGKFIIQHAGRLIEDSTALVTRLKKSVGASGDPEQVAALADLVASTSAAIETVNKIYTQNKKIQAAKELKQQEIEGKKEVAKIKSGENKTGGLLVANREEIFNLLLQGVKRDEIIDLEDTEISDVEKTMDIEEVDKLGPA